MADNLFRKKSGIGSALTKAALILGTVSIIGYSEIKKKLLGSPPSKIRKGLFYAAIAGLILYKCDDAKYVEFRNEFSETAREVYSEWQENQKDKVALKYSKLKDDSIQNIKQWNRVQENDCKINRISRENDSLASIISEQRNLIYAEKNLLRAANKSLDSIIKKTEYQKEMQQVTPKYEEKAHRSSSVIYMKTYEDVPIVIDENNNVISQPKEIYIPIEVSSYPYDEKGKK